MIKKKYITIYTVRLLILIISTNIVFLQKIHTQEEVITLENQNKSFFSILFNQNNFTENNVGSLYLPGDYKQLSSNQDALMVSFESTFIISELENEFEIIFEKGMMDEGMILINDQFISGTIIAEGNVSTHKQIIPNEIINKGINKIKILALSYSESGYINGDFYIQSNTQKIDLKGNWDYNLYDQNQSNIKIQPTQVINLDHIYDFDFEKFTSQKLNDDNWPITNFPVVIEELFNENQLDAAIWFRKEIELEKLPESDVYFNVPNGIDDYDKLYVNGRLVGITNCYNCPRNYRIPKEYLKKKNVFAILVIDKDGVGGIRGDVFITDENAQIDISSKWSYKKVLDLQVLITVRDTKEKRSLFDENEVGIYNLGGRKLDFDTILIEENNNLFPYVLNIATILIILFVYFARNRKLKTIDQKVSTTIESINKNENQKHVFIRADRANHKIEIKNIQLIEGKKDYVKIHMLETSYLVRKNLKTFLNDVPSSKFIRISKSVAVNVDQIKKIDKNMLFLKSNNYYIIGKKYLDEVKTFVDIN
ncbi:MAG: LytTR family transcriptional regulator [Flavobacteriaceae bacterium]|nr:LytTR family transcriptional regulator [Flavobacteriaceae bacterium]